MYCLSNNKEMIVDELGVDGADSADDEEKIFD
jgi:hypothetical protein